jgi:hypothetical protein
MEGEVERVEFRQENLGQGYEHPCSEGRKESEGGWQRHHFFPWRISDHEREDRSVQAKEDYKGNRTSTTQCR